MTKEKIIQGLQDLIADRESFITEKNSIFAQDKQVLEEAIKLIQEQSKKINEMTSEILMLDRLRGSKIFDKARMWNTEEEEADMEEKYYNQIINKNIMNEMDEEEAEKIIDDMYQDKYKITEQRTEKGVVIDVSKFDDIEFTRLEYASVVALRKMQVLRHELEKQEKENTELKELYIKIAKRLEDLGYKHLAKYVVDQIDVKNGS